MRNTARMTSGVVSYPRQVTIRAVHNAPDDSGAMAGWLRIRGCKIMGVLRDS